MTRPSSSSSCRQFMTLRPSHHDSSCHPPWNERRKERLFIRNAVEGSALRADHRPPFCHPERSRGICFAPFSLHKFLQSSSIGHAEEPLLQQEWQERTPGSEAAAIETHVPLLIRCWCSVKLCGGRKAQSRSLDCARDDKRGRWPGTVCVAVVGGRGPVVGGGVGCRCECRKRASSRKSR